MKRANALYWTGLVGFIVTAICCFTPSLVVTLTALGLTTTIGVIDIFLMPLLVLFAVLFLVGLRQRKMQG